MEHKDKYQYFNRELSWLEFNQKVLDEALSEDNPLLERVKFLAITDSNLDEFFMVRVGGLMALRDHGVDDKEPAGFTTIQQLAAVRKRIDQMAEDQHRCLTGCLTPELKKNEIYNLKPGELTDNQYHFVQDMFEEEFFPILTPRALENQKSFPRFAGNGLHLAVRLAPEEPNKRKPRFALISIPGNVSRFITIPTEDDSYIYMMVEDMIAEFAWKLFPGQKIMEIVPFRLTQSANMSVKEDEACDLLNRMRDVLDARKQSFCVRLEVAEGISNTLVNFLMGCVDVDADSVLIRKTPLKLSDFFGLAGISGYQELKDERWEPQPMADIKPNETIFDRITREDIVLFHPYDQFDPVIRLVEEAAGDSNVLAIKQVLYRTSKGSRIIAALIKAAKSGKSVTVLVELKARFDEARNIEWARALEQNGVQVIYGVRNLKTHAKVCVVVRRESVGVKRYVHYGTGNYNESTAKLYSDVSYMTCKDEYGADASKFFNTITGYSQPIAYERIDAAPLTLKNKIIAMIEDETQRRKSGQKAMIMAKVNSLVDPDVIQALYRASQAGVKILLNIRGICCLRPDVKKLSENIQVVSIIDRYLEHARIIYFHQGGDPQVYISSADWMPRNLERRVELLVPVDGKRNIDILIGILRTFFKDNRKARILQADGSWILKDSGKGAAVRAQEVFHNEAVARIEKTKDLRLEHFETHTPQ